MLRLSTGLCFGYIDNPADISLSSVYVVNISPEEALPGIAFVFRSSKLHYIPHAQGHRHIAVCVMSLSASARACTVIGSLSLGVFVTNLERPRPASLNDSA